MTVEGDAYAGWICIDQIVWRGATNATHLLEINDTEGKSVLEPIRAGSTTEDRTIKMHGKWALGLNLVDFDSGTQVDIYIRSD